MKHYPLGALAAASLLLGASLGGARKPQASPRPTAVKRGASQCTPASGDSFTLFESGQVRPLALSPDSQLLFAVNTPDNRLEVFRIRENGGLSPAASVPVGLEPVAVAARSQTEVWVVNHVSDSVSIVDVSNLSAARVVRTLLVGDEPRDIVFGGPRHDRAFITAAHRGQRLDDLGIDPKLTEPGIGRADVWVFDAGNLGDPAGGTPLKIITLFSDTPRALAVTPDGRTVYAAAFHSGNRTTTIPEGSIPDGGLPPPYTDHSGNVAPRVGLIVKFRELPDGGMHWLDERDEIWDNKVKLSLPDKDVFAIDAEPDLPVEKADFRNVGTVLFNMAVNPVSGKVYVSNTDAQNHNRFEGPGEFAGHTVRGHLVESGITVLDSAGVFPRHLNKHIDYSQCCEPPGNAESVKSLAFPTSMAVSNDGSKLYVAAFGSSKVGVFDTAKLEDDSFDPNTENQIIVSGGGPSGVVLDETRLDEPRLYVLTRFDNSIKVINTNTKREIAQVPMCNPEPESITAGRRFLYDASLTSSHGDSACASCHVFGDFDSLAWDLGNPDGDEFENKNPFAFPPPDQLKRFHPMKGPMTTQSLRGMDNHGPLHWRGDRTGSDDAPNMQPNSGGFDEAAGFKKFNVAFQGLVGRSEQLSNLQMQAFTNFVLQIMYPPNPNRRLNNSLTEAQQEGFNFFTRSFVMSDLPSDRLATCNGCHVLDPGGNREFGVPRPGFFGTDGQSSFENEPQLVKIPHLRNLYQKVGMFGMPATPFFPVDDNPFMGDQVRGFGFLHDGSVDTLFRFHGAGVFVFHPTQNRGGFPPSLEGIRLRRSVEAFMLAFDSNLAPIVGQQITLTQSNGDLVSQRIDLLEARAEARECELVVKGRVGGDAAGFLYQNDGTFLRSRSTDPPISDSDLRALAGSAGGELTFTCCPPGTGARIADEL